VFREQESGQVMIETCAFSLNPKLDPGFFDPRKRAREMGLEAQVIAAETPGARLLRGALWGDVDLVREAMNAGADPNARTPPITGRPWPQASALMLACMGGDLRIVERLVNHGAEINACAPTGFTPFDFALFANRPDIAGYIKYHGGKSGNEVR
jgi:ankyrin repeat protein